ncbi:MAG: rhodanese-like domain-containing protein [Deferrisomatales bacterium]|nr:rhodanese-like domain-containing protein [Deferrisomatales bacterium]
MIETLYGLDTLGTPTAFFLALLVGVGFGFALERAGFSSSRRLAGVFYFTDMAVVKVMFSALLTAMLGLSYLVAFGWIQMDQIFLMPTIYGAQIVGGLLFGVGFVMGGWCPGTAAAGVAAGRIDALVFLVGTVGGSILFNELFPVIGGLYGAGDRGVRLANDALGWSHNAFVLAFALAGVAAFWSVEWVEKARTGRSTYLGSPFLKAFSLAFAAAALGLFVLSPASTATSARRTGAGVVTPLDEQALLAHIEAALDHMEPEELADRLMAGEPGLVLADVRPAAEFHAFHIRGAVNVPLAELAETLQPHKHTGLIVLYSNGMTHPAQARDSLQRQGFQRVYLLTDGLQGFRERCLKPVSLRTEPLSATAAARVNAWRAFFAGPVPAATTDTSAADASGAGLAGPLPRAAETDELQAALGAPGVRVLDLRPQPEYNTAHIPGALSLNVESLRGNVGGVPSMLLPAPLLAAQFSLLGLTPSDTVVLVAGDKFHDATLAGMAFERLGHGPYAVLNGGHTKWVREGRPVDAALPAVTSSDYPAGRASDRFTVDRRAVAAAVGAPGTVILDVRPAEFYAGRKSDEARAGHIPGAVNRPFAEDVVTGEDKAVMFKPADVLAAAYRQLIASTATDVIVHCRTGHQASQTYFVLTHLLGYTNVRWYDAGWTEWAAWPDLPVIDETRDAKRP